MVFWLTFFRVAAPLDAAHCRPFRASNGVTAAIGVLRYFAPVWALAPFCF